MRANTDPTFGDLAELRVKMLKWARKLTRGGAQAEDLVQSAFVRMFIHRAKAPTDPWQIDPWAYIVLLNEFRRDLRKRRLQNCSLTAIAGTGGIFDDTWPPELAHCFTAPENPEIATYCRQVVRIAFGIEADMLLAEPEVPETNTQRTQRRRARLELARIAA